MSEHSFLCHFLSLSLAANQLSLAQLIHHAFIQINHLPASGKSCQSSGPIAQSDCHQLLPIDFTTFFFQRLPQITTGQGTSEQIEEAGPRGRPQRLSKWWNKLAYMMYCDPLIPSSNYYIAHKASKRKLCIFPSIDLLYKVFTFLFFIFFFITDGSSTPVDIQSSLLIKPRSLILKSILICLSSGRANFLSSRPSNLTVVFYWKLNSNCEYYGFSSRSWPSYFLAWLDVLKLHSQVFLKFFEYYVTEPVSTMSSIDARRIKQGIRKVRMRRFKERKRPTVMRKKDRKKRTENEREQRENKMGYELSSEIKMSVEVSWDEGKGIKSHEFNKLCKTDPHHSKSLKIIESSIICVALDDTSALTRDEVNASWAVVLSGIVIVWKNGQSGFNMEHSCMDGKPVARINDWMLAVLSNKKIDLGSSSDSNLPPPTAIEFVLSDPSKQNILRSAAKFDNLDVSSDMRCPGISLDAIAQLIMQLGH
ncbi:hypothetical protein VP01_2474g3 [Puccinia sorghi]|uniref:Choline/carnitine acyltransferase domain-containing protein n=1 Tax=Puccinia sorghi TaxID=27349 RepID=A0A0L6V7T4_9BASI|nr:hypothetical protein VP01_2474g3 [Puccinia sorghi]